MTLVAPVAFIKIILDVLTFGLNAMAAEVLILTTYIVHGVGFTPGQLHLAISPLEDGTLGDIYTLVHVRFNSLKEMGAEHFVSVV